jgi:hypothetical protein
LVYRSLWAEFTVLPHVLRQRTLYMYTLGEAVSMCGGEALRTLHLDGSMFAEEAMLSGGGMAFEQMKMTQLKEELGARGSSRSGLKASLQRRLHGLLVQAAIERRAAEREEAGEPRDAGARGRVRAQTPRVWHRRAASARAAECGHEPGEGGARPGKGGVHGGAGTGHGSASLGRGASM